MPPVTQPFVDQATTLPGLVDYHSAHNPDATFCVFASDDPPHSLTRVTFFELGRAVQRFAHPIRQSYKADDHEVVAIVANCDTLLYVVTILSILYAGLVPDPISPRNSPAAIAHMLEATQCRRLLTTLFSLQYLVDAVRAEPSVKRNGLEVSEQPPLNLIFPRLGNESADDTSVPFQRPRITSMDEITFYFHSSGSTGFPKSIPHSHESLASWLVSGYVEYIRESPKMLVSGAMNLPPFHMMGFLCQVCIPLVAGLPVALFEPQALSGRPPIVPGPDNTLEALERTRSNVVLVVPTFLELWSESATAIDYLRTVDLVVFGGGPLPPKIGDYLVSQGVNLASSYGGTEFGGPVSMLEHRDPKDWQWMSFMDRASLRWVPQGDGMYELYCLDTDGYHILVRNLPDVPGYATSDLFVKHPTKEGLWKIVGRLDDVLILTSGEKTVPAPIEAQIVASPFVNVAVMFVRGRNQVGVLIDPREGYVFDPADQAGLAKFRNDIRPAVETANEDAPAFSRLFKEMILVASPVKPLPRTPKGTVQRKAALAAYEREIDAVYETVANSAKVSEAPPPDNWERHHLVEWLNVQAYGGPIPPT